MLTSHTKRKAIYYLNSFVWLSEGGYEGTPETWKFKMLQLEADSILRVAGCIPRVAGCIPRVEACIPGVEDCIPHMVAAE